MYESMRPRSGTRLYDETEKSCIIIIEDVLTQTLAQAVIARHACVTGGGGGGDDGGAQTLPHAMTVQNWRHRDAGGGEGGGVDDNGDDYGGYQRRYSQIYCHRVWVEQRWVQWQQQRERMQWKA